jgi:hypothetical protein
LLIRNGDAVLTTPPTRLIEPADPVVSPCPAPRHTTLTAAPGAEAAAQEQRPAPHVVTAEQVERAVLQLRERPGKCAVEQVHAVLRELGLTVAPPLL